MTLSEYIHCCSYHLVNQEDLNCTKISSTHLFQKMEKIQSKEENGEKKIICIFHYNHTFFKKIEK